MIFLTPNSFFDVVVVA